MQIKVCIYCTHFGFRDVEPTPSWIQVGDNQPVKVMPDSVSNGYCTKDEEPVDNVCSSFEDYS
jgi:hypothetical protein